LESLPGYLSREIEAIVLLYKVSKDPRYRVFVCNKRMTIRTLEHMTVKVPVLVVPVDCSLGGPNKRSKVCSQEIGRSQKVCRETKSSDSLRLYVDQQVSCKLCLCDASVVLQINLTLVILSVPVFYDSHVLVQNPPRLPFGRIQRCLRCPTTTSDRPV
jgi:hypothetical protein